ncbi:MAG: ParA family protein [Clostridia bacterium]|nr:ParA family protein [Clostridia bacterium]
MAKIVAIANQKGGVGKTTTAINLSACLAHLNKKTLLIDLDPQGNSTTGLGADKKSAQMSAYDIIINDADLEEVMIPTVQDNLLLCPANINLAGAEVELVSQISRETRLADAIDKVADKFDYIMIDCPPSLGLLTLNALTAANTVLVPIQCEYFALEGLSQLMETIKIVQRRLNPSLSVEGVVLTMFDSRTNLSMEVAEEVRKHFSDRVYQTLIPRNVKLSEAPSYGLPIIMYDRSSKGAEAYLKLAQEFIDVSRQAEKK